MPFESQEGPAEVDTTRLQQPTSFSEQHGQAERLEEYTACELPEIPDNLEEATLPTNSADHLQLPPEAFEVDGERAVEVEVEGQEHVQSRNNSVKRKRNCGYSYESEKSKRPMPARRNADFTTECGKCSTRGLSCHSFTHEVRAAIRGAFFDLGVLEDQREWIGRHTENIPAQHPKKLCKNAYFLPSSQGPCQKFPVCKKMFLTTLGISSRQVKTVFAKKKPCGILEGEKRGGRKTADRDLKLREGVTRHIDRFPRMESHYCRATSQCQYLSSDLNAEIMYRMYQTDTIADCASLSLYRKVLNEKKLKFHQPKKDTCGLCDTYRRGNPNEKALIEDAYQIHITEKKAVRQMKASAKARAATDPKFVAAVFDLQQVIHLPKSPQSELFYKRRLSNYNFTIYELGNKDGWCFLAHEGITRRGSCEIASHLHRYLRNLDAKGIVEVEFYSDGCVGQNKNSVLPAMLQHFIDHAESIKKITLNYFPTNHGQSEGDSMHSVVERVLKRVREVMVPAQLTSICKLARINPHPYHVVEVQSRDIDDWKSVSQKKGILRIRTSEGGQKIDWTKFMAIQIKKGESQSIGFKYSHTDVGFDVIKTNGMRRSSEEADVRPEPLYINGPPKISHAKYQDLLSLCTGTQSVVWHPDYQAFYKQLPH